jgi:hypothetical protein
MLPGKQIKTVIGLFVLVVAGISAVNLPAKEYKNLKILPQDISSSKLDSIMLSYNKALGVNCSFCHSPFKNLTDSLDYPSDQNPMKENARGMMRMTIHINKTYFYYDKERQPEDLNIVQCLTCHRGVAYPTDH